MSERLLKAEQLYCCNKCGYCGKVGPAHDNCNYHAYRITESPPEFQKLVAKTLLGLSDEEAESSETYKRICQEIDANAHDEIPRLNKLLDAQWRSQIESAHKEEGQCPTD